MFSLLNNGSYSSACNATPAALTEKVSRNTEASLMNTTVSFGAPQTDWMALM